MSDQLVPLLAEDKNETSSLTQALIEPPPPPSFVPERDVKEMGVCKRLFFSWANPLISVSAFLKFAKFTKKNNLHINMMGQVKASHRVEVQYKRLKKSWIKYKDSPGNALFKAVLHAFRCKESEF